VVAIHTRRSRAGPFFAEYPGMDFWRVASIYPIAWRPSKLKRSAHPRRGTQSANNTTDRPLRFPVPVCHPDPGTSETAHPYAQRGQAANAHLIGVGRPNLTRLFDSSAMAFGVTSCSRLC